MDVARTWIPRCMAVLAFGLYALAAPPGLYWQGSAELSAAAVELGVPRPTGFPLYCVLARIASLLPVGEIAFRLHLLSAGCAALAVLWSARLAQELGRDDVCGALGAACAGAALMVSLAFSRQATIAAVHAPTIAALAGALMLLVRVARGKDARAGLALALVCGLGLALHVSFLLLTPVAAALCFLRLYRGARWPLATPLLVALVAGGLSLYLPVRSATGRTAAVDQGAPHQAGELLRHITTATGRDAPAVDAPAVDARGAALHEVAILARSVGDGLGPVTPIFALLGLVVLARQRRLRWPALALVVIAAGDAAFSMWIDPGGIRELRGGVPLSLALCVAAGVGLAWLARYLGRVGPYAAAAFLVMLVIPPALGSLAELGRASAGELPRAWAEAALHDVPPAGVVLVHSQATVAGLAYLTAVEGARPDVEIFARPRLDDAERERLLARDRPLAWELGPDAPPPGQSIVAGAVLSRLSRGPEPDARADIRAALERLTALFAHPSRRDRAARAVHAGALTALGELAEERGDPALAGILFEAAAAVRALDPRARARD